MAEIGYVIIDLETVELEVGALSVARIVKEGGISEHTARRVMRCQQIQRRKAGQVITGLGLAGPLDRYLKRDGSSNCKCPKPEDGFRDWQPVERPSRWLTTSNELQYRICKLSHQLFPNTLGRGKCYELEHLSDDERERVESQLLRHPTVCRLLPDLSALPKHEECGFNNGVHGVHFWVVDRWEDGRTLAEVFDTEKLNAVELRRVMREIAEALKTLHETSIIRRELTPDFVILRDADSSPLLTDLELAKLSEGNPSVSADWPASPYLAPEIDSPKIDRTVDIFSWGQMFLHGLTGKTPSRISDAKLIQKLDVPSKIRHLLAACVEPVFRMRPQTFRDVIKELDRWK